jgi:starch synthase
MQATVKVPADAFKMDFVFSDVESGNGTYDSRGGLDYHLPVEGSAVREPSLYIAHISVEMAPIAKVGDWRCKSLSNSSA